MQSTNEESSPRRVELGEFTTQVGVGASFCAGMVLLSLGERLQVIRCRDGLVLTELECTGACGGPSVMKAQGRLLLVAAHTSEAKIKLWRVPIPWPEMPLPCIAQERANPVSALEFNNDGSLLAVAAKGIKVYKTDALDCVASLADDFFIRACAFSGNVLACVGPRGLQLWEQCEKSWQQASVTDEISIATSDFRTIATSRHDEFVISVDANLQLRTPNQSTESKDSESVASNAFTLVRGEKSMSGFGGGAIPNFLLIDTNESTQDSVAEEKSTRPWLAKLQRGPSSWSLVRMPLSHDALPAGIVDLLTVDPATSTVFAASSFTSVVTRLSPKRPSEYVNLTQSDDDNTLRLRGLTLYKGEPIALVAAVGQEPLYFGRKSAKTELICYDTFLLSSNICEERSPSPPPFAAASIEDDDDDSASLLALRRKMDVRFDAFEYKLDSLLSKTARPSSKVRALQLYVDRRFCALEAKLDALILLTSSKQDNP